MLIGVLCWSALAAHAADTAWADKYPEQTKLFTGSAHQGAGLKCADCHAADPKSQPARDKKAIAEMCATCHSDVRKMNAYGLATDQLDHYKTSKHGEALFGKGDQRVAVCTDCHGIHDILKVKSPQARTYPTNIPQTCGRCHSDAALMGAYKLPADVVDKYKTSYHAKMVFEKGDLSGPTCVTCHGNHGATPPGTKEVGQVCGKCHTRQRELFGKSPHAEAAQAGLISECVGCHGNHAIQKATVELFGTACVQCHAKDPKQLALRDTISGMLRTAGARFVQAQERVRDATIRGLATDDEQLFLQEVKTQITQLEALQHTLSTNNLSLVAARAEELVSQTLKDVDRLEQIEQYKRRSLLVIWVFLSVMAFLFWAKHRQLEQKTAL
jgi:hypothetical protein